MIKNELSKIIAQLPGGNVRKVAAIWAVGRGQAVVMRLVDVDYINGALTMTALISWNAWVKHFGRGNIEVVRYNQSTRLDYQYWVRRTITGLPCIGM